MLNQLLTVKTLKPNDNFISILRQMQDRAQL
jgi:hypothetical protein